MKGFRRGEKGFTLVELLIVVAILGILAAVVIPNVVGLMGRGGKQAFETDLKTVQLAAATFYSDVHAYFGSGAWADSDEGNTTAHLYPTGLGAVTAHSLSLGAEHTDPNLKGNYRVMDGVADADDTDIQNHAIWMGLLVNAAEDTAVSGGLDGNPLAERGTVTAQLGEGALYLNEIPKSASQNNGQVSTKAGAYTWIVCENGVVYGAWYDNGETAWYAGYSGSYP